MTETTENVLLLLTLSSKKCSCCGEVKPTTEFPKLKNWGKWGFHSHCKECRNKKYKKYRVDNPEKCKRRVRNSISKKQYRLTIEDVEIILKNQNNKCAICGQELFLFGSSKKLTAHVDHDHKTGKVRGLLCDKCNRGLGFFRDNEEYLINAASYLKKNK